MFFYNIKLYLELKCIFIIRYIRKKRISVFGGDMVLFSVDGIVILIIGFFDGKSFLVLWYVMWILFMLIKLEIKWDVDVFICF